MYAAVAIQAALARRAKTGTGEWIDLALLDCQVAMLANQGQNYLSGDGGLTPRLGNAHPNVSPYEVFPTADGHMVLAVGTDSQYQKFCAVVERQDLATDPAYQSNGDRIRNRRPLSAAIREILKHRTTEEWLAIFGGVGVACGPIHTLDEVYRHPQVVERNMQFSMDHPLAGQAPVTANPIHFRESPIVYERPAPTLGQHTREVLESVLGLDADEIDRLAGKGVI
jgi:crotonobetainyl-CoA:carnitine CoA-transferase CaiB-like acyl-CoA transferase